MTQNRTISLTWPMLVAFGVIVAVVGALGGWLASRATLGQGVRDYVINHPDILPLAMENLRKQEDAKQLAGVRKDVEKPFPGAVLGNPNGKVVVVQFADYACGYCKKSVADLDALIAENPEIKVVMRELPILSPQSADAAKMALAAGDQGKYPAFHKAMYEIGKPDDQTIEAAAKAAGLDLERARKFAADPRLDAEIDRNMAYARQLGFQGTPSWVIGERLLAGAESKDVLAKAVAEFKAL
ncbi:MAG: DsbA family protein [Novosphingobium sp.]